MSVTGISGAFARIATIESRVGALTPSTGFAKILDQANLPVAQSTIQSAPFGRSIPETVTLGQLIGMHSSISIGSPVWTAVDARSEAPTADWAARIPGSGRRHVPAIVDAAEQAGIEPALLAALVWTESSFQADAVSGSGAIGLGQLMPATAAALGVDPTDPEANLRGAARYLSAQIERFGSVELGLAAYNAGPGRVAESGGIPNIAETQAYVPAVLNRFRFLGGTP